MTQFICIGGKAQNGKDTTASIMKEELESRGKKVLLTHYADLLKFMCRNYFGWNGEKDEAGRTLLQKVGTEGVRSQKPNFWVDFVLTVASLFPKEWDYIIVPDTRFPNEISRIGDSGYAHTFVKVRRPNFASPLTEKQQQHPSEIALDAVVPDFTIINDGTMDDLRKNVKALCDEIERSSVYEEEPEQLTFDFDGA